MINSRGYSISKDDTRIPSEGIEKSLIVKPMVYSTGGGRKGFRQSENDKFSVYRESTKRYYMPRVYGIEKYGKPTHDMFEGRYVHLDDNVCEFKAELREHQIESVSRIQKNYSSVGSCLLCLPCGYGKTCVAIHMISKMKVKTLVVVHKEFLMTQWAERIQEFLPNARIGYIQQNKCDIEDKDVVLAMLQSVSMRDYDKSVFDGFGQLILDECFPFRTYIHTDEGPIPIGSLYEKWNNKHKLPKILSYNEKSKCFEYKEMTYAWRKEREELLEIKLSKKIIKCTPEHKILTINGYKKANELSIGDIIVSKYDNRHIDNIVAPALNEDQLQIIYGSYLGDGCIERTVNDRFRLRLIHCEKQKSYCEWKAHMFNSTNKVKRIEENSGYSNKPAYYFQTRIFDSIHGVFPVNKKEVPKWLIDKLDERGIAIWYMDDGSIYTKTLKDGKVSRYANIHSNNYGIETHKLFQEKFRQFGIDVNIRIAKEKYLYLNFNKENTNKLLLLIEKYIPESCNMQYKIGSAYTNEEKLYKWNENFMDYGTLRITNIKQLLNKGYGRCSKPYVYDIEVSGNHNFVIGTKTTKQINYIDGPVVSNCHHIAARAFSNAMFKVQCKYMLGLSATPDRADGLTILLKWFLGEFEIPVSRPKNYTVHVDIVKNPTLYDLQDQLPGGAIRKASMAGMITKLGDDLERNKLLLDKLESVIKDTPNRKVIILSDRREHLTYLHKQITTRTNMKKENSSLSGMTCGMYIGGMKKQDLKESEDCDIIVSTYSMTSEGFDIPSLNTLFLSTPKSNIEQSVGRILRKSSDINPLVVDTYDNHELLEGMYRKRIRFYKKNGYAIDYGDNRPGGRVFQGGVSIKTTQVPVDKQKNTLDKYAFNDDY